MTDITVSEIPLDAPEALVSSPEATTARRGSWRRNWGYWVALGWIVLIVVLAVLAPILPLPDPNARGSSRDLLRKGPTLSSWDGIMGYDKLGRSILSRSIYGARVSLRIGFGAVAIGTVIGGFIGLLAGYFRRWFETVSNIVTDAMLAFPPLVLLIALAAALGQSATNITIGLAVLSIPTMARLARANTMVFAEREFITAARGMGAKDSRILFREILPNVMLPIASYCFIIVAVLIVAEGSLSFLGVGVQRPTPSWGGMIAQAQEDIDNAPHTVFGPALVMFVSVLALNRIGDHLRSVWDPRSSQL